MRAARQACMYAVMTNLIVAFRNFANARKMKFIL